jgi:hypothetical protein
MNLKVKISNVAVPAVYDSEILSLVVRPAYRLLALRKE